MYDLVQWSEFRIWIVCIIKIRAISFQFSHRHVFNLCFKKKKIKIMHENREIASERDRDRNTHYSFFFLFPFPIYRFSLSQKKKNRDWKTLAEVVVIHSHPSNPRFLSLFLFFLKFECKRGREREIRNTFFLLFLFIETFRLGLKRLFLP